MGQIVFAGAMSHVLDPDYYDRVVADVKARNAHFRRSADPAADPCRGRPRRKSRYPGHAAVMS